MVCNQSLKAGSAIRVCSQDLQQEAAIRVYSQDLVSGGSTYRGHHGLHWPIKAVLLVLKGRAGPGTPWGCAGRAVAARALHQDAIPGMLSFQDESPAEFRMIIGQT